MNQAQLQQQANIFRQDADDAMARLIALQALLPPPVAPAPVVAAALVQALVNVVGDAAGILDGGGIGAAEGAGDGIYPPLPPGPPPPIRDLGAVQPVRLPGPGLGVAGIPQAGPQRRRRRQQQRQQQQQETQFFQGRQDLEGSIWVGDSSQITRTNTGHCI
jgi:hypothetical protein